MDESRKLGAIGTLVEGQMKEGGKVWGCWTNL